MVDTYGTFTFPTGISVSNSNHVLLVPPPPKSKLRIVAGSEAFVILHPRPKPNILVRFLTRVLLRMEWVDYGEPDRTTP